MQRAGPRSAARAFGLAFGYKRAKDVDEMVLNDPS